MPTVPETKTDRKLQTPPIKLKSERQKGTGSKYATTNPYTGEVLETFPEATDGEVMQAIATAHGAFLAWKEVSFAERGRILQKAADILRRDADSYAKLLTLEMGKIF